MVIIAAVTVKGIVDCGALIAQRAGVLCVERLIMNCIVWKIQTGVKSPNVAVVFYYM